MTLKILNKNLFSLPPSFGLLHRYESKNGGSSTASRAVGGEVTGASRGGGQGAAGTADGPNRARRGRGVGHERGWRKG